MRSLAKTKTGRLRRVDDVLRAGLDALNMEAEMSVTKGHNHYVHVRVIAPTFSDMPWAQREELVWGLLEEGLSEDDLRTITLLMAETPEEAGAAYGELRQRHESLRREVRATLANYGLHAAKG